MQQQKCSVCGVLKDFSEFHRHKLRPSGIGTTCKVCANVRAKKWFSDNAERGKATRKEWYAANREATAACMKRNRLENYDVYLARNQKWRRDNKVHKRESDRRWQAANPEKVKVYRRVSEAKRRASEGFHTADDVARIRKLQHSRCAICRAKLPLNFEIDHIVPLARGGTNWRHNIQLLCQPCNLTKHARDPIDHMRSLGRLL